MTPQAASIAAKVIIPTSDTPVLGALLILAEAEAIWVALKMGAKLMAVVTLTVGVGEICGTQLQVVLEAQASALQIPT